MSGKKNQDNFTKLVISLSFQVDSIRLPYFSHSMANLNITEKKHKTDTTTARKLMTLGININKDKNPPFWNALHKIFKNCFLSSKSYITTL